MQTIADYLYSRQCDIDYLLCFILGFDKTALYAKTHYRLTTTEKNQLAKLIKERNRGVPLAQLTHRKYFYELEIYINECVLIPRTESELLVDIALNILSKIKSSENVLELGSGSAAIIANLAKKNKQHYYLGSDVSFAALKVGAQNLRKYRLNQVKLVQSDWFSAIKAKRQFALIIANPPYIAANDSHLDADVLKYEPRCAFISKEGGLADLKIIIKTAGAYLCSDGYLLLEHGFDQQDAVVQLLQDDGYSYQCFDDLSGQNRAVLAKIR